MRRLLGSLALIFVVGALTAGAALAADGPRGPIAARGGGGPLAGTAGVVAPGFTCARAEARLARIQHRIALVSARIAGGKAKNPDAAARFVKQATARAAKVQARIAARCG